jgi:hypothetical protein
MQRNHCTTKSLNEYEPLAVWSEGREIGRGLGQGRECGNGVIIYLVLGIHVWIFFAPS